MWVEKLLLLLFIKIDKFKFFNHFTLYLFQLIGVKRPHMTLSIFLILIQLNKFMSVGAYLWHFTQRHKHSLNM